MPGWMRHKLESRLLGEVSVTQICRWHHSDGRKWRGTEEPVDESERGEWKSWLKTQHSEMKIMTSSSITSWQIDGNNEKTVRNFLFLGSKITADGYCTHEIKRCLLLGKKFMTNLEAYWKAETLLCQQRSVSSRLWFFQWSCMDVTVGLWIKLSTEELMLLNCGVGEDSWESLGLQGDQTS